MLVEIREDAQQGAADAEGLALIERPPTPHVLGEVLPVDVLHHEIELPLFLEEVGDVGKIGMAQLREGLGLAHERGAEAIEHVGVRAVHLLHGPLTARKAQIVAQVYGPEPSPAERAQHPIAFLDDSFHALA